MHGRWSLARPAAAATGPVARWTMRVFGCEARVCFPHAPMRLSPARPFATAPCADATRRSRAPDRRLTTPGPSHRIRCSAQQVRRDITQLRRRHRSEHEVAAPGRRGGRRRLSQRCRWPRPCSWRRSSPAAPSQSAGRHLRSCFSALAASRRLTAARSRIRSAVRAAGEVPSSPAVRR